jgi:hypothetical protein
MKTRLLPKLLALVAALVAIAMIAAVSSADAAPAKHKRVYWISLSGDASQHPHRVYFTANSGGYMKHVTWTDWGKRKAVGRGTFGTTSPCGGEMPPCPDGPAKMVLRKPVKCTPTFGTKKGKTVLVYRHARLTYPDGEGGTLHADISDRAGWATCKQAS